MGLGLCPRHLWRTEDGVSSHSGGSPFYSDYEGHSTWYLLSLDCWVQLIDRGPFCEIKPAPLKVQSQNNYNVTGTRKKAFCSKEEMKFWELNFLFLLFCTRGALYYYLLFFLCVSVCTHMCSHASGCMCRGHRITWELLLSFHHEGHMTWRQAFLPTETSCWPEIFLLKDHFEYIHFRLRSSLDFFIRILLGVLALHLWKYIFI